VRTSGSTRKRTGALVAGVACAVLVGLLAACTATPSAVAPPPKPQPGATVAPTPDLGRFYAQRPAWKDCKSGFQCATISVPLDYAAPAGPTISLALIRLPAADPKTRIGALLVNPGGPGVSGVDFARDAATTFSKSIRSHYDIVGFDPRGVGASTPVECISDKQQDALTAYDGSPDTPAEITGLYAISKQFADGCEAHSAALLPHIGTADAARDMDVIRAVMGDAKLHYYGASYGTLLGATYANEFPSKVGRMVLDGALDPTLTSQDLARGQLGGFVGALNSFLADCVRLSSCPVGHTVAEGRARIAALIAGADAHPLPSSSGRPVTQSLVVLGVLYPLYDRQNGWPILRQALTQANQGNGDTLLAVADEYADRGANGHYGSNVNEANYAVNCLDRPDHSTVADIQALSAEFSVTSPILGPYFAWGDVPCTVWPVKSGVVPGPLHAVGAAPILVLGTTRDPATPYQWAVNLANELSSGRLLSRVGDGHTAYGRGSPCIDTAVQTYLVSGVLPPKGTVCH
jgi:pimeloyl-ACP methyl ester carboxylesterase